MYSTWIYSGAKLYNAFFNDIFYTNGNVYNQATDNTVRCRSDDISEVKSALEYVTRSTIKWFKDNYWKVDPDNCSWEEGSYIYMI